MIRRQKKRADERFLERISPGFPVLFWFMRRDVRPLAFFGLASAGVCYGVWKLVPNATVFAGIIVGIAVLVWLLAWRAARRRGRE